MCPYDAAHSGIYAITNLENGHRYIGSAVNLRRRSRAHLNCLKGNRHENSRLQRAWNKYGEDSFRFEVLEYVLLLEDLIPREQHYVDTLKPAYNLCPVVNSQLGMKRSEETLRKLSVWQKGKRKHSEETRRKMSESRTGRRLTEEQCRAISERLSGGKHHNLGKHWSEEHRRKIGEAQRGKVWSEESRRKLSASQKGRARPPGMVERMRDVRRGEGGPNHKLVNADVLEIRRLLSEGNLNQRQIAEMFHIDPSCISNIKFRKSWNNI